MKAALIRLSGDTFDSAEDALEWLNNEMPYGKFGFGRNKPQQIQRNAIAIFSFDREILGEAKALEIYPADAKIDDVRFGEFVPYAVPVEIAVGRAKRGYRFPTEPGQQYGYYRGDVLREIRNLAAGGVRRQHGVVNAESARKIGRANEKCAMGYERRVHGARIIDKTSQNVGYDFESIRRDGSVRLVEVKTKGDYVQLTPNELSAARRHHKDYFLYVVGEGTIRVIHDPAAGRFETEKIVSYRYTPLNWPYRGKVESFRCK